MRLKSSDRLGLGNLILFFFSTYYYFILFNTTDPEKLTYPLLYILWLCIDLEYNNAPAVHLLSAMKGRKMEGSPNIYRDSHYIRLL